MSRLFSIEAKERKGKERKGKEAVVNNLINFNYSSG